MPALRHAEADHKQVAPLVVEKAELHRLHLLGAGLGDALVARQQLGRVGVATLGQLTQGGRRHPAQLGRHKAIKVV